MPLNLSLAILWFVCVYLSEGLLRLFFSPILLRRALWFLRASSQTPIPPPEGLPPPPTFPSKDPDAPHNEEESFHCRETFIMHSFWFSGLHTCDVCMCVSYPLLLLDSMLLFVHSLRLRLDVQEVVGFGLLSQPRDGSSVPARPGARGTLTRSLLEQLHQQILLLGKTKTAIWKKRESMIRDQNKIKFTLLFKRLSFLKEVSHLY